MSLSSLGFWPFRASAYLPVGEQFLLYLLNNNTLSDVSFPTFSLVNDTVCHQTEVFNLNEIHLIICFLMYHVPLLYLKDFCIPKYSKIFHMLTS